MMFETDNSVECEDPVYMRWQWHGSMGLNIHQNRIQRCLVHCQIRPGQAKKKEKKGELHSNAEWLEVAVE